MKMLQKKKGKSEMPEKQAKAKMDVLNELMDMMSKNIEGKVGAGLKKVTVAAPDDKGLEEGLEMAEELVSSEPESEESDEMESEESDEMESEEKPNMEEEMKAMAEPKESPEDDEDMMAGLSFLERKLRRKKMMMDEE